MGFGAVLVSAGLFAAGGPGEGAPGEGAPGADTPGGGASGFEAACKSACVYSQQAVAMHISAIEAQCEKRCAGDRALPLAVDRVGLKARLGERVRARGWLSVEEKKGRRLYLTLGDGTRLELLSGPGLDHPDLGTRLGKLVELAGTLDSVASNLSFVSGVGEAEVPAAPKAPPAKGG